MAFMMQKEFLSEKKKRGASPYTVKSPAIRDRVCRYLGISTHTYSKIMNAGAHGHRTGLRGNFTAKSSRIPKSKEMIVKIRNFVRSKRENRERVTATQVMEYLHEEGDIVLPFEEDGETPTKRGYQSALRCTRRWLVKHGYKRGKGTGNLSLKLHIVAARDNYLTKFFENRAKPPEQQKREVYLDESYIHQHYHKNNDSLFDPNDPQGSGCQKQPHKGNRYCFCAAIQGVNPLEYQWTDDREHDKLYLRGLTTWHRANILQDSVWVFCPQKKNDHKGDYHKVFKHENFIVWWKEKLLPALGDKPHLIIMDNASYHCKLPDYCPKLSANVPILKQYLDLKGVPYGPRFTKPMLQELVRAEKAKEKPQTVLAAEALGHEVLFTPPYHSDLQPIELLWAKLKGNIGRKYSKDTTMTVLKQRLDDEFKIACREWMESLEGMIWKCSQLGKEFLEKSQQAGNDDNEVDASDSEDDDDSIEHVELFAANGDETEESEDEDGDE